jgi:hypothetical protein
VSRARKGKAAPNSTGIGAAILASVEPQDGLGWGLRIQRHREPKDWPAALLEVPEQHRAQAEEYLRGIAARMRTLRAMGKG